MYIITSTRAIAAAVHAPEACAHWTNFAMSSAYPGGQALKRALRRYGVSERYQKYQAVQRPKPVREFGRSQMGQKVGHGGYPPVF